nr:Acetyl-coenzyme A synthetase [Citrobacter werkmanii]
MSQIHKHAIPANIADRCLINPEQYEAKYQQSVNEPDTFWGEQERFLIGSSRTASEEHLVCAVQRLY